MKFLKVYLVGIIAIFCVLNVTLAEERPKVLITRKNPPKEALDLLKQKCSVTIVNVDTKNEILNKCKGMSALFWATNIKLDADILNATGSQLKVVGVMSENYDQIDTSELKKRGIKLANAIGDDDDAKALLTSQNILRGLGGAEMFTPVQL